MKTSKKYYVQSILGGLILCSIAGWLVSSCFLPVNKEYIAKLTIQDSTGKPIPGFSLTLVGMKYSYTRSYQVERYYPTADQTGVITQKLSWHDGITSYEILVGSSYIIDDCLIPGYTPTPGTCSISYADNVSAVIRVKKVR